MTRTDLRIPLFTVAILMALRSVAQDAPAARWVISVAPLPLTRNIELWDRLSDLPAIWEEIGLKERGPLAVREYGDNWSAFSETWERDFRERPPAFVVGESAFIEARPDFTETYQELLRQPPRTGAEALLVAHAGRVRSGTEVVVGVVDPHAATGGRTQLAWLTENGYTVRVVRHGRAVEALLHLAAGSTDLAAVSKKALNRFALEPRYAKAAEVLEPWKQQPCEVRIAVFVRGSLLVSYPGVAYAVRRILLDMDESFETQALVW